MDFSDIRGVILNKYFKKERTDRPESDIFLFPNLKELFPEKN